MDWESLYSAYADDMLRVSCLITGNRALAEDVCQEVFVRCMASGARIMPGKERAYLISAAVNRCRDEYKSSWRKRRAEMPQDVAAPAIDGNMDEILRNIMDLPDDLRSIIVLHDYQGFTLAETAKLLLIPAGTAASRLSRARETLRGVLGKEYA